MPPSRNYYQLAVLRTMGSTRPDDRIDAVLAEFFKAQKQEFTPPRRLAGGISVIVVDDDHSLVNSFLIVQDAGLLSDTAMLRDAADKAGLDPARTLMIVPSILAPRLARNSQREMRGVVRRVVRLTDFLDGFLRPGKICAALNKAGVDEPNSPDGLLFEDDFIQPWANGEGNGRVKAMTHLVNGWAEGQTPRLCMLLAPAGYGKSKLTHILAKRLARRYEQNLETEEQPPLPMLIPFGQYRRSTSFTGLVLSALDKHGNNLLTIDAFRLLIARGRVLFILDGYDEMIESQPDTARGNIAEFVFNAGPGSRVLLTSRSVFYRNANDILGEVEDPLLAEADVEVLELQPFDRLQAKEFLRLKLEDPGDRSQKLERAQAIVDRDKNMEILGSPFFLAEFARLIRQDRWSMTDGEQRGSLEFLISTTFARERERQEHGFTDDEQRAFIETIAFDMLVTGVDAYSREDLELFSMEAVSDPEQLEQNGAKLWTHHFLHTANARDTPTGATMSHQVWRDYFQGSGLAARLSIDNRRAWEIVQARDLPEGVLRATTQALGKSADRVLANPAIRLTHRGVRNALRMALLVDRDTTADVRPLPPLLCDALEGCDLSELNFTGVDFHGVNLHRTKLSGCHFHGCDLRTARLDEAVLNRTTFSECHLDEGILKADLSSVTIDYQQYYGPQLRQLFPNHQWLGEAKDPLSTAEGEFRKYSERLLRERLKKFYPGGRLDECISWFAFMGVNSLLVSVLREEEQA
jgi:hypothetical protein